MLQSKDFNITLKNFLSVETNQMDQLINQLLHGKHLIKLISEHLIFSGGKRLRPSITILIAKLLGYYSGTKHINLAVSIEFIHTATLLHDDVVDESNLRRGKKTSNNIWGNQAPILVGDYLLSQAFKIMTSEEDIRILQILSEASSIIAEGEVLQLSFLSNFSITEDQYIEIIKAKTAELFGAAASVGAAVATRDSTIIKNFYNFGISLGIAFQIIDDIMDYSSHNTQMGKEAGDDFRSQKITLPLLISYKESNEDEKNFIKEIFLHSDKTQEDFQIINKIINQNNGIEKSFLKAQYYIEQSKNYLSSFEDCVEKRLLLDLLDFSLKRLY